MQVGTKRLALGVVVLILGLVLIFKYVGIPLFLLGIVLILWAIRDRERAQRARQLAPPPVPGGPTTPGPLPPPPPPLAVPPPPVYANAPPTATPSPSPPVAVAPPAVRSAAAPSPPPPWVPPPPSDRAAAPSNLPAWPAVPLTTAEMVDPSPVYAMARGSTVSGPQMLVISPDSPTILSNANGLEGREIWRLTRSEGDQQVSPADPDRLGDVISRHLEHHPGGAVVFVGLEKVVDAAGLRVAIRLLDVARESAENHHGRVLVSLNTDVLKPAEIRQLEQSSTVLKLA